MLLAGVDTLDCGLFVEFGSNWPKIVAKLAQLKRAARGTGGQPIAGGRCLMSPGGKANYPYLLQYPAFQLYLSRKARPDGETPNVYVSPTAQSLWHLGEQAALDRVLAELQELAPCKVRECRISRCDLAVDVLIPGGLPESLVRSLSVTQSRKFQVIGEGEQLQTYYVGSKDSPIQLRIYNKSLETIQHEKLWFLPLWGLEINHDVWRVEFQLRRPYLHSCGINSLADLQRCKAALWSYLTQGWFSLREQDNTHVSRRSVHPLWATIQEAVTGFGDVDALLRRQQRQPSRETDRVVQQMASLLVGFGARKGLTDRDQAAEALMEAVQQTLDDQSYATSCQRKAIQLGIDLTEDAA